MDFLKRQTSTASPAEPGELLCWFSHDVEKIASMASYPFVLNGKASVPNRAAFISHYRQIFTPEVIEAVEQQSYDKLWSNWQGVMIGDGEVWFAGICPDSSCSSYEIKIISVNN